MPAATLGLGHVLETKINLHMVRAIQIHLCDVELVP
jgi:hypothetical protein